MPTLGASGRVSESNGSPKSLLVYVPTLSASGDPAGSAHRPFYEFHPPACLVETAGQTVMGKCLLEHHLHGSVDVHGLTNGGGCYHLGDNSVGISVATRDKQYMHSSTRFE